MTKVRQVEPGNTSLRAAPVVTGGIIIMAVIGLREQTVKDAKNVADARARHRWQLPADYNIAVDCIDRHTDLRDKPALFYEDDEGHVEKYTFGQIGALSRRFANALSAFGVRRGDVVAI